MYSRHRSGGCTKLRQKKADSILLEKIVTFALKLNAKIAHSTTIKQSRFVYNCTQSAYRSTIKRY